MIDYILHLDVHLTQLIENYHQWAYLILALIVFCETGLVATPFLPGDSLLFAIGAISVKTEFLSLSIIIPLLFIAALLGDNLNYFMGKKFGTKLFKKKYFNRFLKRENLERTHQFYEKHGGKTIVIARFLPIIRTFAPFVAGIAQMPFGRFILFSVGGALFWIVSLTLAGFFLGNLPVIKDNFQIMVLIIIAVSLLPVLIAYFKKPNTSNTP
jgi:membrane-associated protein